ncbi:hypothetical protein [Shinella sp. M31]|uniref:hypothetical protein n=1 Tax=Shinella sp. M31 TaxID=3368615 RepID=UPI003BA34B93
MSQINIHPAVARQEDAALIAHYQNRNLLLAQMVAEQKAVIDDMAEERAALASRLDELQGRIEAFGPAADIEPPPAESRQED